MALVDLPDDIWTIIGENHPSVSYRDFASLRFTCRRFFHSESILRQLNRRSIHLFVGSRNSYQPLAGQNRAFLAISNPITTIFPSFRAIHTLEIRPENWYQVNRFLRNGQNRPFFRGVSRFIVDMGRTYTNPNSMFFINIASWFPRLKELCIPHAIDPSGVKLPKLESLCLTRVGRTSYQNDLLSTAPNLRHLVLPLEKTPVNFFQGGLARLCPQLQTATLTVEGNAMKNLHITQLPRGLEHLVILYSSAPSQYTVGVALSAGHSLATLRLLERTDRRAPGAVSATCTANINAPRLGTLQVRAKKTMLHLDLAIGAERRAFALRTQAKELGHISVRSQSPALQLAWDTAACAMTDRFHPSFIVDPAADFELRLPQPIRFEALRMLQESGVPISSLTLGAQGHDTQGEIPAMLAAHAPNLKQLRLRVAPALQDPLALRRLTTLGLNSLRHTPGPEVDALLGRLVAAEAVPALRAVNLACSPFGDEAVASLCRACGPSIERLVLSQTAITPRLFTLLLEGAAAFPRLRELGLAHCPALRIAEDKENTVEAPLLALGARMPTLRHLVLSGSTSPGHAALEQLHAACPTLKTLRVSHAPGTRKGTSRQLRVGDALVVSPYRRLRSRRKQNKRARSNM